MSFLLNLGQLVYNLHQFSHEASLNQTECSALARKALTIYEKTKRAYLALECFPHDTPDRSKGLKSIEESLRDVLLKCVRLIRSFDGLTMSQQLYHASKNAEQFRLCESELNDFATGANFEFSKLNSVHTNLTAQRHEKFNQHFDQVKRVILTQDQFKQFEQQRRESEVEAQNQAAQRVKELEAKIATMEKERERENSEHKENEIKKVEVNQFKRIRPVIAWSDFSRD